MTKKASCKSKADDLASWDDYASTKFAGVQFDRDNRLSRSEWLQRAEREHQIFCVIAALLEKDSDELDQVIYNARIPSMLKIYDEFMSILSRHQQAVAVLESIQIRMLSSFSRLAGPGDSAISSG